MPEISQDELDALTARANQAPVPAAPEFPALAPAGQRPEDPAAPSVVADETPVTITRADLDALIARAKNGDAAPDAGPVEPPPDPTHVALLANGERYEYFGGHPTNVAIGDTTVPVLSVHPLTG
jgi:hypothetical protein